MEDISWHTGEAFMPALVAYLVHAVAEGVVCCTFQKKILFFISGHNFENLVKCDCF